MPRGRKRKAQDFVPPRWIRQDDDDHDGEVDEHDRQHQDRQVNILYEDADRQNGQGN